MTNRLIAAARQHAVGDLLRRTAARYPDKLAIIDGEHRLTFGEFDRAVNRCANSLAQRGLRKGDRLALLSHNCWQYAVLAFATARLGVVLVPANFMLMAEEIAFILRHCGATAMVTEGALATTAANALESAGTQCVARGWIGASVQDGWEDVDAWIDDGDDCPIETLVADDDPLRLTYTSGTEARPKGVVLSSRSLTIVDRKKDMIKTGGENVASREVEEAIYRLDAAAEVAVFGISHPQWIEAVTAVIVAKPGATLTAEQVHARTAQILAGYKRPKYVVFADSLPKNPSGKILKKELRTKHAPLAT